MIDCHPKPIPVMNSSTAHSLTARFRPLTVKMTGRSSPWHHVAPGQPAASHTTSEANSTVQLRMHMPATLENKRAEIIGVEERQRLRGRRTKANTHSKRRGTPKY